MLRESVERLDQEETAQERSRRLFAAMWERNVGSLDDTPAVKRALFDLVDGTADIQDAEGNNLWDSLVKDAGGSGAFRDFFSQAAAGEGWKLPKLDLSSFGWGRRGPNFGRGGDFPGGGWWSRRDWLRSGGTGGSDGFSIPGLPGGMIPVAGLAVLLIAAVVFWRLRRTPGAAAGGPAGGPGPWPVDPRRLATRGDVVLAFEHLGVLLCGPAARTWTHTTLARALAALAATHGEAAGMLARLYEMARYAPVDEPLTEGEVAEARRLVCGLAGLEAR